MVLLDNDTFLTGLTKLFQSTKVSGSVFFTMKKYNGRTKPVPRKKSASKASGGSPRKGLGVASSPEPEENLCLIRATDGKKKISTVVHAKDVTRFQLAYATLLKTNLDGLKKRDKKTAKAAAAKAKKSKATV
ncbi:signal recognition particle 14 kDa protein-like [Halichondria panicea]|uniref:signal recognition particle 14 kDa protein-like n=1 Tax=Halichondria panicea TaxID=6063 RepID=UPI00312B9EB2